MNKATTNFIAGILLITLLAISNISIASQKHDNCIFLAKWSLAVLDAKDQGVSLERVLEYANNMPIQFQDITVALYTSPLTGDDSYDVYAVTYHHCMVNEVGV